MKSKRRKGSYCRKFVNRFSIKAILLYALIFRLKFCILDLIEKRETI
jgi:hypothetical protein